MLASETAPTNHSARADNDDCFIKNDGKRKQTRVRHTRRTRKRASNVLRYTFNTNPRFSAIRRITYQNATNVIA